MNMSFIPSNDQGNLETLPIPIDSANDAWLTGIDLNSLPDDVLRTVLGRTLDALAGAQQLITRQEVELRRLERLSITDPATALLNRRGFVQVMRRALDRARRYDETGALLIIDLDGFKAINDTYGHAAGDHVLATVARILCFNVRASDETTRLGGDEFAILMTGTSWEEASERANALDKLLNQMVVPWRDRAIQVRGSIGVECYGPGDDATAIYQRADAKMYREKVRRAPDQITAG